MRAAERARGATDLRALSSLYEATRAIGMSQDLDALLDEVLLSAQQLTGHEHWAILLLDSDGPELVVRRVRAAQGWVVGVEGKRLPVSHGLCGWAVVHGRAVRVGDVARDPRYLPGLEGARSNMVIPLIVGHEAVGALNVESPEPDAFTAEDEKLLTVLAAQAALAIVASRTTERLELRVRELDALFQISRLVSSGRDLDWVLREMLEIIQSFVPAGKCALLLFEEETGMLRVQVASGYLEGVEGMAILAGEGITGRCFDCGAAVIVDDLAAETGYIPGISDARSEVALPLVADGRVVGVLNVESTAPAAFELGIVRLLEIIAHQAATVIQATRWFLETARLASTDPLTGLANRRRFLHGLDTALRRTERYGERFAIVLFDIDRFKSVNDAHGHETGDRVLVAVARVLREGLRDTDIVGRLGGEEFGAILAQADAEGAFQTADRLRRQVSQLEIAPESGGGDAVPVTVSAGVAACPGHGTTDRELLRAADQALYRAKGAGRDRVLVG